MSKAIMDLFDSYCVRANRSYEGRDIKNGDLKVPRMSITGDARIDEAAEESLAYDKANMSNILVDAARLLPFAAAAYDISPNIEDYVIQPIEIIRSEIPNRNGVGFTYGELVRFNPNQGDLAYRTWIGKGAYVEHQKNRDPYEAAGMILDVALRRAPEFEGNFYRLNHLIAYDRNKRKDVANDILTRKRTGYSMGSMCNFYRCSICLANVNDLGGYCEHIDVSDMRTRAKSMRIIGDRLAYSMPVGVCGIECSSVATPAAQFAVNDSEVLWKPREDPSRKFRL